MKVSLDNAIPVFDWPSSHDISTAIVEKQRPLNCLLVFLTKRNQVVCLLSRGVIGCEDSKKLSVWCRFYKVLFIFKRIKKFSPPPPPPPPHTHTQFSISFKAAKLYTNYNNFDSERKDLMANTMPQSLLVYCRIKRHLFECDSANGHIYVLFTLLATILYAKFDSGAIRRVWITFGQFNVTREKVSRFSCVWISIRLNLITSEC